MNIQFRKFFESGAGGSGGDNPLPPSLSDLDKPSNDITDPKNQKPDPPADAKPDPGKTDPPPPVEGLNADGTAKEGWTKNADGSVTKNPDKPADPNNPDDSTQNGDEGDDPLEIWKEVDKLRGEEVQIEYPEGMDPLSPEGIYHREKIIEDRALDRWEEHVKKTDPRGFAYLMHRARGGSDEDFFAERTLTLPEYDKFKEDKDLQIRVYKQSLLNNGLDEETVELAVAEAIKKDQLFKKADAVYQNTQKQFQLEMEELEKEQKAEQERFSKMVTAMDTTIVNTIEKGLNFIIPDADKPLFNNFIRNHIQYNKEDNSFLLVQKIGTDNLARQMEAMYFQFKNGNLGALIQREAQTQNVKRLKANLSKEGAKKTSPAQPNPDDSRPPFVPLADLGRV